MTKRWENGGNGWLIFCKPFRGMMDPLRTAIEADLLPPPLAPPPLRQPPPLQVYTSAARDFFWRLAELNVVRVVLLCNVVMSFKLCAFNLLVIVMFELAVCMPSTGFYVALLTTFLQVNNSIGSMSFLQVAMAITSIVYNQITEPIPADERCALLAVQGEANRRIIWEWIGVGAGSMTLNILIIVLGVCLFTIMALVFEHKSRRLRQWDNARSDDPTLPEFNDSLVFQEAADVSVMDHGMREAVKCAFNYGFYKAGAELSLSLLAMNAIMRMDMIGVLYLVMLVPLALLHRSVARILWPALVLIVGSLFFLQYAFLVGMPEENCYEYPWHEMLEHRELNDNLVDFFALPNAGRRDKTPLFLRLVFDAFVLIVITRQHFVFQIEGSDHPAGDNYPVPEKNLISLTLQNPYRDFISYQRNSFDYAKAIVAMCSHWVALILCLTAGLGGRSLFNIGYLGLAFWMFWQGNNLYRLGHSRRAQFSWKTLLSFNLVVMLLKVCMQVLACGFMSVVNNQCMVRQWLNVACMMEESDNRLNHWRNATATPDPCPQKDPNEMPFDALAFAFLLFHIRLLKSHFFQWSILEFRCEDIQATSGALLINQLISKEAHDQYERQISTLKNIAQRANELRQRYESQHENLGHLFFRPETFHQAKHSGDYYMFEYDPHLEENGLDVDLYGDHLAVEDRTVLDPLQIIYAAFAQDFDLYETLRAVEAAENIADEELRMLEAVRVQPRDGNTEKTDEDSMSSGQTRRRQHQDQSAESFQDRTCTELSFIPFIEKYLKPLGRFLVKLGTAALHYATCYLRRYSRQYRYVSFVLAKEKVKLKLHILNELKGRGRVITPICNISMSQLGDINQIEREARSVENQHNELCRFFIAFFNYLCANTDLACFMTAIVAHAYCGGLITLPLPFLIFFWGSLSNPRAEKAFWVIMMVYTQLIIAIKCVAQIIKVEASFTIMDRKFTQLEVRYYLGLQEGASFAVCDVVLLLFLFLHRYMLQRLGLWSPLSLSNSDVTNMRESVANCGLRFFLNVVNPKKRFIGDVYAYTFFLDMICLLIAMLMYSSFADTSTDDIPVIHTSRIPISLVIMTLTFIMLIIIDRALYLRKCVVMKLIYHFVVVIALHVWMFFVIPFLTRTSFPENTAAQVFYVLKGVNLLLSGWQIKNGYPPLCTGNMLTRTYGILNYLLFKGFMNLPFAFELRSAIDWTWTDTAMNIFDFIKVEIYYANVYLVKCTRVMEQNFPVPRGQMKSRVGKHLLGIPIILLVVTLILSPIVLFALLNQIGERFRPVQMRIEMSLSSYPPFYETVIEDFQQFTDEDRSVLYGGYHFIENSASLTGRKARLATYFLTEFYNEDIYKVKFDTFSASSWRISRGALDSLYRSLIDLDCMLLNVNFEVQREKANDQLYSLHHLHFQFNISGESIEVMTRLLNESYSDEPDFTKDVIVAEVVPYYMLVTTSNSLQVPDAMLKSVSTVESFNDTFGHVRMSLNGNRHEGFFWNLSFTKSKNMVNASLPSDNDMVIFVDRMFPSFFTFFTHSSIVAMYAAVVYVAFRFIRSLVFAEPLSVIIMEMPNPDYLLKIFLDIYLVREAQDFLLEEELYAKMIFLFRSPATLIKWTRYKVKHE